MFTKLSPETRLYVYGIATAAVPLLISLGVLAEGVAQDVILLVAAVLGVAGNRMSAANVNTQPAASTTANSEQLVDPASVPLFSNANTEAVVASPLDGNTTVSHSAGGKG